MRVTAFTIEASERMKVANGGARVFASSVFTRDRTIDIAVLIVTHSLNQSMVAIDHTLSFQTTVTVCLALYWA